MKSNFSLSFEYNIHGYGDLILRYREDVLCALLSRTGSLDAGGRLINAINPQTWYISSGPEDPVPEECVAMFVKNQPGIGWKWRLWPYPAPNDHLPISHYLIHPDGGLPGSK